MRAIVYTRPGDASVLTLIQKPSREPGPGEVRVQIHRSGVNPTDWKSRRGSSAAAGSADEPQVPGQDGAGVIDAVGDDINRALLGQRVWIWQAAYRRAEGTTQEFAIIRSLPPIGA